MSDEYQLACLFAEKKKIKNCWVCPQQRKCDVSALLSDLNSPRYTCPQCKQMTREEHIAYCPFCGIKIDWLKYNEQNLKYFWR